jgi:putative oxidoreductase
MNAGLLLLRIVVGLTMASHGSQKLFGWFGGAGLRKMAASFESRGIRPGLVNAVLAGLSEFGGGVLLALGLLTPVAGAAIIAVMVVAIVTTNGPRGFFNTDGGFEYNLVLMAAALAVTATGPGTASLDYALGLHVSGVRWGAAALVAGIVGAGIPLLMRGAPQPAATARPAGPPRS